MALQAEALVEEWFNRNGYFTIRGLKDTIDENDILAIKNVGNNEWDCVHCEVQVGIRPVTYICKLTNDLAKQLGVKSSSAKLRTEDQIELCVQNWIKTKYTSKKKFNMRNQLMKTSNWRYVFVHGNVKEAKELSFIEAEGVAVIPFKDVLSYLCNAETEFKFSSSSAGDLIDIIKFIKGN